DRDPSSISLNSSRGWLRLQGGSVQLDGGDLRLRAARNGQDVQIDAIQTRLTAVGSVDIEAVKVYDQVTNLVGGVVPAPT
ncbi:hypothetical protein Q6272_32960, partial [Klebsiella pneumoniae]